MTAHEYANELVCLLSDSVGPVPKAMIRQTAEPLIRRVIDDCASKAEALGEEVGFEEAFAIANAIRQMKG